MSRYIDADEAKKVINGIDSYFAKYIDDIPTADVVERKKGEWIFNPTDAIEMMFTKPKCSECGFESADGGNFCSNCGADMRKEVKR